MTLSIRLVRHGESSANAGLVRSRDVGDHAIELTPRGAQQARAAGACIGAEAFRAALLYSSPYRRTRQTMEHLIEGAGLSPADVRVFEDPRLREVEHGYEDTDAQQELRRTHGWFYYRFEGGESPADCFDRTSSFLESLMRQVKRRAAQSVIIASHGMTLRCFVMRFLHLRVEDFDEMVNPENGAVVTIARANALAAPVWRSGRWGVEGLRRR